MRIEGEAKRVTVFIGEADRWHHQRPHIATVGSGLVIVEDVHVRKYSDANGA